MAQLCDCHHQVENTNWLDGAICVNVMTSIECINENPFKRKIFLYYILIFWDTGLFLFSRAVSRNHQNENKIKRLKYVALCVMNLIYIYKSFTCWIKLQKKKEKKLFHDNQILRNASVLTSLCLYLWSSRFGHIFRRLILNYGIKLH